MKKVNLILFLVLMPACRSKPKSVFIGLKDGTQLLESNPEISRFYKPIAHISFNAEVVVVEWTDKGFIKVQSGSVIGWIDSLHAATEKKSQLLFVNSLEPVVLRETADEKAKGKMELLNNERLQLVASHWEDRKLFEPMVWYHVAHDKSIGWIKASQAGVERLEYFFMVRAFEGLNLRAGPSTTNKIENLMPYKTTGRVISRSGPSVRIQNQDGFWLEVELTIGGKRGWLFSGFVLIGRELDQLEMSSDIGSEDRFQQYLEKLQETPDISKGEFERLSLGRQVKKTIVQNYEMIEVRPKKTQEPCPDGYAERLVFRNMTNGKHFMINAGHTIHPPIVDYPLRGTVTNRVSMCGCCCDWPHYDTYFLGENKVLHAAAKFSTEKKFGSCFASAFSGIDWGQSVKKINERQLFAKFYFPDCAMSDLAGEQFKDRTERFLFASKARHILNVVLTFDSTKDRVDIRRYLNKSLSDDEIKIWESVGEGLLAPEPQKVHHH